MRAELAPQEVIVAPGDEEVITLIVSNDSSETRTVSLVPSGLAQGWSAIDRPSLTILAGAEELVAIRLRPPRAATVPSGTSTLTVRVVPMDDPTEIVAVDGAITVLAFDDRRIEIAQPVQRARRSALYDVLVDNSGNIRASCRLSYIDNTGRTTGRFDPPSVGIEPGMSAAVKVRVKAKRRRWRFGSRALPFAVHALQDDHATVIASASMLQEPILSSRSLARTAFCAATAGALVGGWYGVAKPTIEEAAERAVERSLTVAPTTTPTSIDGVTSQDPATPGASVTTDDGEAVGIAETLLIPSGKFVSETVYTVPTGFTFMLTEMFLQNPSGDVGRFTVTAGTDVIYNPDPSSDDVQRQQFFTPWPVTEGKDVTVSFENCEPGDATLGQCSVQTLILGRLVPNATAP